MDLTCETSLICLETKNIFKEMAKKLTVLVAPSNEAGHINACTGLSLPILRRGHRVIFVIPETWRGKLAKHGFEEHVHPIEADSKPTDPSVHPGEHYANVLHQYKMLGPYSPKEKLESVLQILESEHHANEIRYNDAGVKVAIEKYRPDLAIVDLLWLPPSIYYSGLPWIKSLAMSPMLMVFDDDIPPGGSGFPTDGDRSEWAEFNKVRRQFFVSSKSFSALLQKMGYEPYPDDAKFPSTESLTVYGYPDELNYPQIRQNGLFNLEAFNKVDVSGTSAELRDLVPKEFYENTLDGKWSGKWIYVSMGSMASVDVELMKRVTSVLAKTNHKCIVSKGPRHDQYDLPKNMWGEQYLPQTKIVPLMDLVITHGGNNTTTETFSRGIPMIAMPLFADQFDNAQRLVETGLGLRIDPYTFKDDELISSVEKVLNDAQMLERLRAASKRIQASNRHEELVDMIEQLICKE